MNRRRINNIRFTDETIIFTDNLQDIKINKGIQISREFGLDINTKNLKHMIISKNSSL